MMRRMLVLLVAAVTSTACSELPWRPADVEGAVTAASASTLRIESGPTPADGVIVRITDRTRLYRDIGGTRERIAAGDVRAGPLQRARMWFAFGVATSGSPREADVVLVWTLAP